MPPAGSLRADDHPECRSGGPPCLGRRTAMRARQRSWTTPGTLSISRGGAGFRPGGPWGRSRRRLWTAWLTTLVLAISFLPATVWPTTASRAKAATTCGAGCHVTVNGLAFSSGAALTSFNFIGNVDNSKLPADPLSLTTESADNPLPLGKIRVFVFNDNAWTNGAPDTEEAGLGGFQVGLEEQTGSAVTVDYNNNRLCGGICKTSNAAATRGFVEINNLGPATYFIDVHPPQTDCNPAVPGSRWYQTTTIDGGLQLMAPTEEGADGTGAPGEQLWEPPNIRTAYWFGFVCSPQPFANAGTGEIVGQARNWVEWAPYTTGTFNDPVENPFLALSDASSDLTVFVGQGDADGNFDIQNVPAGDYNLAVWDEQLSYIMRFKPVHVEAGQTVNVNDTSDDPNG